LKLRNQITKQLQGSGVVVAVAAILLTPFALFINGKNAKYERGTVFDTYIDETIELRYKLNLTLNIGIDIVFPNYKHGLIGFKI